MSLNDLQKYIQNNKHLPGVPSADKLNQDGLDLAQMNTVLLEKIEELTLHILKLNEEFEKLKSSIK